MTSQLSEQVGAGYGQPGPGAQLRALREAAQLSIDDVAQQLKLARRQVVAIENDDLDELPGPTFVRGFIRNYARLLRVDAEPLLEAGNLIVPSTAPIQQLAPTMGELPLDNGLRQSWTRWLIPTALVLVLAAGISYYEFGGVATPGKKARKDKPDAELVVAPPAINSEPTTQSATAESTPPAANTAPVSPRATVAPREAAQPAAAAPAVALPEAQPSAAAPAVADTAQPSGRIDLELVDTSWIQVRDGRGELLVSRTLPANDKQSWTGVPPFTVRIGKASAVRLQFEGSPVDLAPHTRAEIAQLTLPLRPR